MFPPRLYTGESLNLLCGPPADNVGIGTLTGVRWLLNGNVVQNNAHFMISNSSDSSTLAINRLFTTDTGQ